MESARLTPETLAASIEASAARLLDKPPSDSPTGALVFTSAPYEALPVLLQQDPMLAPVDKIVFNNIWIWARQQGSTNTAFPGYEYLMRTAQVERATLATSLTMLRLTRYLTLCRRVRHADTGRFAGQVYAVHDEPIALGDAIKLDAEYMAFIRESATQHRAKRVRQTATLILRSIQNDLDQEHNIASPDEIQRIDRRLQRRAMIEQGGSAHAWFGAGKRSWVEPEIRPTECTTGGLDREHDNAQRGDSTRVQESNAAEPACVTQVQKMNSVETASETQVQKLNLDGSDEKLGQNVAKSPSSKFEPGSSISSYINKKTTTTSSTTLVNEETARETDDLVYPDSLTANERDLAARHLARMAKSQRQTLLDELGGRIEQSRNSDRPIRNRIDYLNALCKAARRGELAISSAAENYRNRRESRPATDRADARTSPKSIQHLLSELRTLDLLIAGGGPTIEPLSRQRDRIAAELERSKCTRPQQQYASYPC